MTETLNTPSEKAGLPPGSLVHIGDELHTSSKMSLLDYNQGNIEEKEIYDIQEALKHKGSETVTWLTIEGLADVSIVEAIGAAFDIHQLVLEDILNTHQRAKFEEHDDYLFIVLKYLESDTEPFELNYEQISLLVMENFVIVFKEKQDELFKPISQRIKNSKGRFRTLGSDYLAYTILDTIVDQYFTLIDCLDDAINNLEEELLDYEPTEAMLHTIHKLKREIIHIRRHIAPLRELMSGMLRCDSELIHEKTYIYLKDVMDHVMRIIESVESHREILSGLLEIYMTSVSNKMNEVMKVLTVFASIFIPLTFMAGVYGMNFEYMPELKWKWAYPTIWGTFIIVPAVLVTYFKKKNWL
ncbi:MAG: magnesium/cobalt transporter CorA [Methyloprofundus sp.]|nr:magnesium/cobalt transporter CorA [Methyloprofundus sp.]